MTYDELIKSNPSLANSMLTGSQWLNDIANSAYYGGPGVDVSGMGAPMTDPNVAWSGYNDLKAMVGGAGDQWKRLSDGKNAYWVDPSGNVAKIEAIHQANPTGTFLKFLGTAGALTGLGALAGIGGAGAAAGAAGGAAGGATGGGTMGGLLGNGAFLGEGALSGIGAWDAAMGGGLPSLGGLLGNSNVLKGLGTIAGAIGGAKPSTDKVSQTVKLDPRLDAALYGKFLPAVTQWAQSNMGGVTPNMQAGWDRQLGILNNPQIQQQMSGLMNQANTMAQLQQRAMPQTPVAKNPYLP